MKKTLLFLTVALFMGASANAQELIVNGGLEDGVVTPFYGSPTISTTEPHSGTYRINLGNDYRTMSQDVVTVIGQEYTVSFWYRMANEGVDATDHGYAYMKDAAGQRIGDALSLGLETVYTNFTYNFVATSTSSTFYIYKNKRAAAGTNNAMWFDDISIVPASATAISHIEVLEATVYPNPVTKGSDLFIQFQEAADASVVVEIVNINGQTVYAETGVDVSGSLIKVSTKELLSQGVYIVKVSAGSKRMVQKVIIN
ncbi:T9SS type A sorting domain-containing protein [Labilibacter sediminis]|nr:T9SS type A sorting domain-containing protein [Labilibacter sediminis]